MAGRMVSEKVPAEEIVPETVRLPTGRIAESAVRTIPRLALSVPAVEAPSAPPLRMMLS